MRFHRWFFTLGFAALAAGGLHAEPPSFSRQIQPFLDTYCVSCHGNQKAKGGVNLQGYSSFVGGDLVVPGKPDVSLLVLTMEAKARPRMPPSKSAQPIAEEIALVRQWVAGGAANDGQPGMPAAAAMPRREGGERGEAAKIARKIRELSDRAARERNPEKQAEIARKIVELQQEAARKSRHREKDEEDDDDD